MKPLQPHSPEAIGVIGDVSVDDIPLPTPAAIKAEAKRDASNLVSLLFSSGLVSLTALLFNIVLTRTLSVEDYGHLGVIRTVLDLMGVPAAFGMGACIARFAADARTDVTERSSMLVTALWLTAATSALTIAGGSLVLMWPGILPDAVALSALRWLILIVPFTALFATVLGYLQGVGQVKQLAVAQAGRGIMRLALGSAFVWMWGFGGWMAGIALVEALAFLASLRSVFRRLAARPKTAYFAPFVSFSGYATVTLALTTLLTGVDVLCLVYFHSDPAMIAHYKVATYIFSTALLLPNTFIQARWSKMVAHAYDADHVWRIMSVNTMYLMALVLPATAVAYFAAPILPKIFGEGYVPSVQIFRWLLPAYVITSAGKLSSNLVVGAGLMRAQLATSVATLALNVVLNIALIPSMGVAGAVIATTGSLLLKTSLSPWVLSRYRADAGTEGGTA